MGDELCKTSLDDAAVIANRKAILTSPSYRLAEQDVDFLARPEQRPLRMQMELLKTDALLRENRVVSTIVVFGGTQITSQSLSEKRLASAQRLLKKNPDDPTVRRSVARAERVVAKARFYDEAREFGRIVSTVGQSNGDRQFVVMTGGGPGVMEAANRGAFDVGAKSDGLNIELPHEQEPNPYITPELCFQFHYFAMRKFHFILRAAALVVFSGGYGTLDELFDTLTLRQTKLMQEIPIILYGREFWPRVIDFQYMADEGVVADADLDLMRYAETSLEAWNIIAEFYGMSGEVA